MGLFSKDIKRMDGLVYTLRDMYYAGQKIIEDDRHGRLQHAAQGLQEAPGADRPEGRGADHAADFLGAWVRLPIRPATIEDRYGELIKGNGSAAKLAFRKLRAILNFASAEFGENRQGGEELLHELRSPSTN